MILYIHGFASCGDSNKTRILKSHFGESDVFAPDLPVDPDQAVGYLCSVIEYNSIAMLVGSSLGGFYAAFLSAKYGVKSILINPSTKPYETLAPFVGVNTRWCDNTPFRWESSYLDALKRYEVTGENSSAQRMILLQTGDEVLDYRVAAEKYRESELLIEEGGNHRFENLGDYLEAIASFYRR